MTDTPVDLRSDTLTQPSEGMRAAMAQAVVGDDVYGEDPTVNRLQERASELLGKEAALLVPSGTMANQIALLLHCERGDEVLVGEGAHCMLYESGAGPAWAGVSFQTVGAGGFFDAAALDAAIRPDEYHFPRSRLVALENTHNRAGGRVFPQQDVQAIAEVARARGLAVHMDGARIWNAAVATGKSPAELASPCDTVSACFSKGLGAPVGSVLAGSRGAIQRARRLRKMLGGGMRQAGVLAAAALHALEHQRTRLQSDHDNARLLAQGLAGIDGIRCDATVVETNIVNFAVEQIPAAAFVARAAAAGVKMNATGAQGIRAVTHLHINAGHIERALAAIASVLRQPA